MASMFRASPWVTYQHPDTATTTTDGEPGRLGVFSVETTTEGKFSQQPDNPGGTTLIMDMDVDMDVDMEAPQISTLRDEESPPPAPAPSPSKKTASPKKPRTPKVKVTPPVVAAGEAGASGEVPSLKGGDGKGRAKLGEEGEEDQLIDDDIPTPSAVGKTPEATPKKKAVTKRKSKKEKELKVLEHQAPVDDLKKKSETAENMVRTPSNSSSQQATESSSQIAIEGMSQAEPITLKLSAAGKKKQAAPRKSTGVGRGRGRGGKTKAALMAHLQAVEERRDAAATSEGSSLSTTMSPQQFVFMNILPRPPAGYTGTAPSSPGTAQMDLLDMNEGGTPEPDNTTVAQSSPPMTSVPLATAEEVAASLEGVAIPQYPLPTKPFPVQPPVKVPSGFAPPMQLDRSTKKVRHWRTAKREIRGIAGGRWFAKTWVGDKESDYASAQGNLEEGPVKLFGSASMAASKFSGIGNHGLSVSAPAGRGRGRGGSKAASAAASAAQSRSGSVVGEPSMSASANVMRPPTKMRILQLAPSENGDSDMAPPES